MVLLENVDSGLQVAHEIALRTSETLSDTARKIYTALVATGLEVALERQYSPTVSQVVFFACAESIALSVGCHPSTVYRKLPELSAAGLVSMRGHYCTHNGRTRLDGSVIAVRLRGSGAVRVPFDYLKRSYRCLGADIEQGRTAWAQMRESYLTRDRLGINLSYIRRWALSKPSQNPVRIDSRTTKRVDISAIFDVPAVRKRDRAEKIFEAAKAMSVTLNDDASHRFYMAVLWSLIRIKDQGGGDFFAALYQMIQRVLADIAEGFALNGAALLTSRLRETQFWPGVQRSP